MPGKHARLSSSKTEQWWNCPASVGLTEQLPNQHQPSETGSAAAIEGTAAHTVLELALEQKSDVLAFVGANYHGVPVTKEMCEAVQVCVDYVDERLKELTPGTKITLESKTNPLPKRKDTGGTADITLDAWPQVLEVIDYKHGQGIFVPVEENKQLRSYILGKAIETKFSHDLYRYTIVQPRHPHGGVSTETVTRAELQEWAWQLEVQAAAVDEADQLISEGLSPVELLGLGFVNAGSSASHCKFCPVKPFCPAHHKIVQEKAAIDFEDEPEEIKLDTSMLADQMSWIPAIKAWVAAMEEAAEKELLTGRHVPGYKIVRKTSPRKWVSDDQNDIAKALKEEYGLDENEIFVTKLKTGPQVEKLIPKEDRRDFSNEFLQRSDAGFTIAPEGDRRPAVDTSKPGDDFAGK